MTEIEQTFDWINLFDTIKWPIVFIIVFIIGLLIMRKPLVNLINRVTKVGYGNKTLEANQQTVVKKGKEQETSQIDIAVGLFRPETIEMFKNAVEQETKVSKLNSDQEKVDRLTNYSCILYIKLHFDIIYNSIFGSQIRILERLNTLRPETKDSLKYYYEFAEKNNPSFFENYPYKKYLDFMFEFNLIIKENDVISITILGVDFLKYLTETNKDVNKLN